ncbi:MAG TPA: PGPGW domain-containing protein [Aquiluna sp.]
MEKLKAFLGKLPHPVRWALVMVIGFVLLIMGLVMLVTPGPGLLFIFFGTSILALEIKWARELNQQGMQGLERIVARLKKFFNRNKNKDQ